MRLELTQNPQIVQSIMFNDEIWDKVRIDGLSRSNPIKAFPKNKIALKALVNDEVIGVHLFTEKEDVLECHPMLLKEFRRDYGREFFSEGLDWVFNNTDYNVLEAVIPMIHRSTINLVKKLGFKQVGIDEKSILIDGVNNKRTVLSLSKPIEGIVLRGVQDQRKGFKTANIDYKGNKGVFLCDTNYGKGLAVCVRDELEVHIFEFSSDIYGKSLQVTNMKEIDKRVFLGIGLAINDLAGDL